MFVRGKDVGSITTLRASGQMENSLFNLKKCFIPNYAFNPKLCGFLKYYLLLDVSLVININIIPYTKENYIYMPLCHMCVYISAEASAEAKRRHQIPGAGVTGGCALPSMGTLWALLGYGSIGHA